MTFLSIVTRCYKRPDMLVRNTESLAQQTEQDFEQLFITDDKGLGVAVANRALVTANPAGDYVMILDDDDMLINDRAIELLKEAIVKFGTLPELVIFKADHAGLGILPSRLTWGKRPVQGRIGSCDFITRRDVWEKHITAFGVDECGDYAFLRSIWTENPNVVWLDEILAGVQRISKGAPA